MEPNEAVTATRELIADRLARWQIVMSSLLASEAVGLPPVVMTAHTNG